MKFSMKNAIFISLSLVTWGFYLQILDTTVQTVIVDMLGQKETVKGVILALANAVPLLFFPYVAKKSDRCVSRYGKRTPFIFVGTVITVFGVIAAIVCAYALNGKSENNLSAVITYGLFMVISSVGIGIYRPAAVAVLPDLTPKNLRAEYTAVKNIFGSVGGFIIVAIALFLKDYYSQLWLYIISAVLMSASFIAYRVAIDENKMAAEVASSFADDEEEKLAETLGENEDYLKKMPSDKKRSLAFLLSCTFFVGFGYFAITATYINYAETMWGWARNLSNILIVLIGVGGAICTPVAAVVQKKIGRKKTLLLGIGFMLVGYIVCSLMLIEEVFASCGWLIYVMFAFIGIGWGTQNVIVYPMVMQLSDSRNNGRFSSLFTIYYTLPKVFTVLVSAVMFDALGYEVLFPYSLVSCLVAFICVFFVKHGEETPSSPLHVGNSSAENAENDSLSAEKAGITETTRVAENS